MKMVMKVKWMRGCKKGQGGCRAEEGRREMAAGQDRAECWDAKEANYMWSEM